MITAKDVYQLIKVKNQCEGIDYWIEHDLSDRFNSGMVAVVSEDHITSVQKWKKDMFIETMKTRGFNVQYACDDRPCGHCYFTISIPTQER